MELINKINEAFKWLNRDLMYVAMIEIVDIKQQDLKRFTKEDIEEQSFDHWYEWSELYSEDSGRGEALIPLIGDMYMKFEFNS